VVEEREAEVADGIWQEISTRNDLYNSYLGEADEIGFSDGYDAE
jgi:hypothetical protein